MRRGSKCFKNSSGERENAAISAALLAPFSAPAMTTVWIMPGLPKPILEPMRHASVRVVNVAAAADVLTATPFWYMMTLEPSHTPTSTENWVDDKAT